MNMTAKLTAVPTAKLSTNPSHACHMESGNHPKMTEQTAEALLHPVFDAEELKKATPVTKGLPASPGAATGQIVFSADDAATFAAEGKKLRHLPEFLRVSAESKIENAHKKQREGKYFRRDCQIVFVVHSKITCLSEDYMPIFFLKSAAYCLDTHSLSEVSMVRRSLPSMSARMERICLIPTMQDLFARKKSAPGSILSSS